MLPTVRISLGKSMVSLETSFSQIISRKISSNLLTPMTTESRALELLGQGLQQSVVAGALGVTEARITQLLSDESFSRQVSERRIQTLTQRTQIDQKYDDLESEVLDKLKKQVGSIYKPEMLLKAAQILNQAKRRGAAADSSANLTGSSPVVSITLPAVIIQQFTKNSFNQILEVTDGQGQSKSLVTATSAHIATLAAQRRSASSGEENQGNQVIDSSQDNRNPSGEISKSDQQRVTQKRPISGSQLVEQIKARISERKQITVNDL